MSWEKVKIGSVCEVTGGTTPSTQVAEYWDGNIPWLSPVDLPEVGTIVDVSDSRRKITSKAIKTCSLRMLPEETVVYSTRASIGKIGVVTTPLTTNQGFTNMIPGPRIYHRYLAYALKHFTPQIASLGNSTTFVEVSRTAVKNFQIPLPPLDIQRQIADTLDKAAALRRKDQELLQKYDELAQSIFYEMFGDPVRNEKGWQPIPLGQLTHGKVSSLGKQFTHSEIEYIDIASVDNTYKRIKSTTSIPIAEAPSRARQIVAQGDVLVSTVRPNLNAVALVESAQENLVASTGFCVLRPNLDLVTPEYLFFVTRHKSFIENLVKSATGASYPAVSDSIIKSVEIGKPPHSLTIEFANKLSNIHQQKVRVSSSLKKSALLFNSLLHTYFS